MSTLQKLAAGLLLASGGLHLLGGLSMPMDTGVVTMDAVVTLAFGVIYLAMSALLFLSRARVWLWLGAVLPVMGLLLAAISMALRPALMGAIFIAFDIVIATCCISLLAERRSRRMV